MYLLSYLNIEVRSYRGQFKLREKGEGLRNIQNTYRWNYSALASSRQVSIYWLGFYVLIFIPSLIKTFQFEFVVARGVFLSY